MSILSSFKYCLDATIPIFILMILGYFLRYAGIFTEKVSAGVNSYVFRAALPALLFYDLAKKDFAEMWDGKYVLFCFFATLASILLVMAVSHLLKRRDIRGEFIQVGYRSSAAILGALLAENLYGDTGMVPLMILGSVPLYNVAAVAVLEYYKPENVEERSRDTADQKRAMMRRTIINVLKNPIILGIAAGLGWSLIKLPIPVIADRSIEYLARTASPLGIMALGASFDFKESIGLVKEASLAAFMKLFGLGMIFLPICVALGFTGPKLAAAIVMCGSPSTVSCYIMAREMGHKGVLTSNTVMLTTLFSSVSITMWLFIFKTQGLL